MAKSRSKSTGFSSFKAPQAPKSTQPSSQPEVKIVLSHDQIARLAYEVWLRKGRPTGQDAENWREAEETLRKQVGVGH